MAHDAGGGWVGLRGLPRESPVRAILVTFIVCGLCSGAIATAVTFLRPFQDVNRARERTAHIEEIVAAVPGLESVLGALSTAELRAHVVELASGADARELDPMRFDARRAAHDPATSVALPAERDTAGIGRRAHHATVFLVHEQQTLRLLVLPVYGTGYISTLYGYLALESDLNTVAGLSFYEHAETPGLGSEIENPDWRRLWVGKKVRDPAGALRIGVARGRVDPEGSEAPYQVDGLSGATRTGIGVTNLLRFWLGPDGFGPFLERVRRGSVR